MRRARTAPFPAPRGDAPATELIDGAIQRLDHALHVLAIAHRSARGAVKALIDDALDHGDEAGQLLVVARDDLRHPNT